MSDTPDHDEQTLAVLRAALRGTDAVAPLPVPPSLLDAGYWIQDWATADADLAAIEHDSAEEIGAGAARSAAPARSLIFRHGPSTVDLDIATDGDLTTIRGYTTPPASGAAVATVGGQPVRAELDDLGAFVLRVRATGATAMRLELTTGVVRLPRFDLT